MHFFLAIAGKRGYSIYMTSKQRMKSWEALDAEPKPSWETWKRILRMPHIDHDPKRAKQQWDKIGPVLKLKVL